MFRAYDAERERLVAVKLFKLDLAPERVHQLVAALEQLIAADLIHPVMAVPLATGMTGVSAYLAQDYVAAESLDLAVREYGPAPPADALRVAAQLAGALDFGAVVNVSHGALHPRDVLLSADETRLTGIGVTRALESIGVPVPVRRPYTAPERMAGREWDRRADVFSLAALVHELLWGRRITGTGSHVADGLTEVAGGRLAALRDTFARALADDPHDRFDTALEFAEALKSAFPEVALVEPPSPRKASLEPSGGKRRPPTDEIGPALAHGRPDPRLPLDEAVEIPVDADLRVDADAAADDFDLRAPDAIADEGARYRDVEPPPPDTPVVLADAVPAAEFTASERTPVRMESIDSPQPEIEQTRSPVWPLMAALAIGLALGFAGGYGIGTRERTMATSPVAAPAQSVPDAVAPAGPGRDSTEVAVSETSKPSPPPVVAAPAAAKPATPAARTPPPPAAARAAAPRQAPVRPPARPVRPAPRAAVPAAASTSGRFVGRLSVESKPSGARVFLDGKLVGTTPLAVETVAAGSHAVRIERDGYRRWTSSVRVVAAEQNRVTASLER